MYFAAPALQQNTSRPQEATLPGAEGGEVLPATVVSSIRPSLWMTVPMWLALLPVFILGIWWPQGLWHFFEMVATDLGGSSR
jgi:hydrogenase-4 component F